MEKKVANALGGKSARPCEDCRKRRARWYCAADDAFLCQSCDSIIHSANPLAQRHERVRLKTSSSSSSLKQHLDGDLLSSWHKGFTRKARSVRPHRQQVKAPKAEEPVSLAANPFLVPEVGVDEMQEENEAQLLYRVPTFDPIDGELHASGSTTTTITTNTATTSSPDEQKPSSTATDSDDMDPNCTSDNFACFFPSDMDLAEFEADVESLLGRGLDDESFCLEGLGLQDSREPELDLFGGRVKKEEEDEPQERASCQVEAQIAISKDSFELNFDYDTPTTGDEDEEKVQLSGNTTEQSGHGGLARRISLRLNYEAVMTAWAGQGAPWTNGDRPQLNPDDCWPDCMGMNGIGTSSFVEASIGVHAAIADGGREARVSRYREKRRTRLFSKKIRYEVRKLNAEKRPRMKGRFVKRTASFVGTGFAY